MGVGGVLPMAAVLLLSGRNRGDALRSHGHGYFAVTHGALQRRTFQTQAVDQQQPGRADLAHIPRCQLITVCIGVGGHQRLHLDALPAKILRHIGQDAETGNDRQRYGSPDAGTGQQEGQPECFEKKGDSHGLLAERMEDAPESIPPLDGMARVAACSIRTAQQQMAQTL